MSNAIHKNHIRHARCLSWDDDGISTVRPPPGSFRGLGLIASSFSLNVARQHRNPFSYDSPFPLGLILVERRTAAKIECVLEGENYQGKGSVYNVAEDFLWKAPVIRGDPIRCAPDGTVRRRV